MTPTAPTPISPAEAAIGCRLRVVGGGNMAQAIVGGLRAAGWPAAAFEVIEPVAETRARWQAEWGIPAVESAAALAEAAGAPAAATGAPRAGPAPVDAILWAVKPQTFVEAAQALAQAGHTAANALHLSIMAGVRSAQVAQATQAAAVVRAMPNTPALIGRGMAGLWAAPGVDAPQRALAEAILKPTGQTLWVAEERLLDAVTALSGSGPAYVFYWIEAMVRAGSAMGLPEADARRLAETTLEGAAALSAARPQTPVATLREQVTSKGGTTHAALESMRAAELGPRFEAALHAAEQRARELGGG